MTFNFYKFRHTSQAREEPPDANDRHLAMLKAIAPYAKPNVQKNVTDVSIYNAERSTDIIFILLPEWSANFPPFNLARLSAVVKQAGYNSQILDINVQCFRKWVDDLRPNKLVDFEMWNSGSSWRWIDENYYRYIHPLFESIFVDNLEKVIEYNPTAVGFTMYQFNEEPVKWMIQYLKKRLPYIKIIIGGSNVQHGWFQMQPYYDYVVNGEGEEAILKILHEIENNILHTEPLYIKQPVEQRINLNNLPMPDYESIDFNAYEIPNGALSELSRGCTAVDALKEIEWLYYNKGTDIIWFIDSLVNGNLKELRAFAKGVVAKGMKIKWTGYARCDGRMDLEYMQDLADSGCVSLNYGCETGSQKILNDIDKGVTVAEMEQNFRDGKAVGISAATNWIVGFPTETYQDFADTMTFLWRNRNMNISNIGTGMGFGMGPETIVGQNPERFNLSGQKYLGYWITKDFKLSGSHVLTRLKSFHILIDHLVTEQPFDCTRRPDITRYHYDIEFEDDTILNDISYEKFDYDIIKTSINPYADSLVNEIWPVLRVLWKARGGFTITVRFSPELDNKEFGNHFGTGVYNAEYKFTITTKGIWSANFKINFKQVYISKNDPRKSQRHGPFFAQEFSRMTGNAAQRARTLAKPRWGDQGRSHEDFNDLLKEELTLNRTVDWSFDWEWQGAGSWKNHEQYNIDTPANKYQQISFYNTVE